MAAAVVGSMLCASGFASAAVGLQSLTFGDYPEDTEISNQYGSEGILFKDTSGYYPEIRYDRSATTNPTLSGTFGLGSTISAEFVAPGTTNPAAVENLSMDVGYVNEPGSTVLRVERASGVTSLYADYYGFNHLSLTAGDIVGFTVETVGDEPAGWEIDNLQFTIPAPPPPPVAPAPASPPAPISAPPPPLCPTYAIFDTRGSGEPSGISQPGNNFIYGFEHRLTALKPGTTFSKTANGYKARGVFSWTHWSEDLNGIGAFLGVDQIGAYRGSEREGESEIRKFVSAQVSNGCSAVSKIVLPGYSQGAEATGNVFQGLSPSQRKHVAAVVLWGDPLYNHDDDPADRGDQLTFDGSIGKRPEFPADKGKNHESNVFSYCNTHDPICQEGMLREDHRVQLFYYRLKEHSLYYKTDEALNDGSAVASYLARGG